MTVLWPHPPRGGVPMMTQWWRLFCAKKFLRKQHTLLLVGFYTSWQSAFIDTKLTICASRSKYVHVWCCDLFSAFLEHVSHRFLANFGNISNRMFCSFTSSDAFCEAISSLLNPSSFSGRYYVFAENNSVQNKSLSFGYCKRSRMKAFT